MVIPIDLASHKSLEQVRAFLESLGRTAVSCWCSFETDMEDGATIMLRRLFVSFELAGSTGPYSTDSVPRPSCLQRHRSYDPLRIPYPPLSARNL